MKLDPVLTLHEVVEEEDGQSTSEISQLCLRFIDYCVLHNDRAWSDVHYGNKVIMHVKESPDELETKIKQALDDEETRYTNMQKCKHTERPRLCLIQDREKCVLINLAKLRTIRPVSKFSTVFSFKKGTLTVRLPMEWLNVSKQNKYAFRTK